MSYAKQNYIKSKMALEFAKMGVRSTAVEIASRLIEADADEVRGILSEMEVALEILEDARKDVEFAEHYFEKNKSESETLDDVKDEEEE
jgi:hypothetical protein